MDNTKGDIGSYIQFRQSFAKETFSYDEQLKSEEMKYESHKTAQIVKRACSELFKHMYRL